MRATAAFVAAVWISTLLVPDATAATALKTVQERVSSVVALLGDASLAGDKNAERRRAQIREVVMDLFDFPDMARRTLGQHWAGRSAPEQLDFVALFQDVLERSYVTTIESYAGESIAYEGEAVDGAYASVKSKIVTRLGIEIAVDYRLYQAPARQSWKVFDIVLEGCSVVANYRAQFDRIIGKSSFAGLMERLRQKDIELMAIRPGLGERRARGPALLLLPFMSRQRH